MELISSERRRRRRISRDDNQLKMCLLCTCESTEAFVWGKRQKIIADSCQGFQEEW